MSILSIPLKSYVPKRYYAIDPGTSGNAAWALFDKERLVACGNGWPERLVESDPSGPIDAVVELPKVRRTGRSDPNDLVKLAFCAGVLARHATRYDIFAVFPETWKGSIKKEQFTRRIEACLSNEEKTMVPVRPRSRKLDHNVLDAIGLGKWVLTTAPRRLNWWDLMTTLP